MSRLSGDRWARSANRRAAGGIAWVASSGGCGPYGTARPGAAGGSAMVGTVPVASLLDACAAAGEGGPGWSKATCVRPLFTVASGASAPDMASFVAAR